MKQLDLATAAAKQSVYAGRLAAVRRPAVAKVFSEVVSAGQRGPKDAQTLASLIEWFVTPLNC